MNKTVLFSFTALVCTTAVIASEKRSVSSAELQAHVLTLESTVKKLSKEILQLHSRVQSLEDELTPRMIPMAR